MENGLNNETCESSTDNLENGLNNETCESSIDNLETVQETNIDTLPTTNNATNAINYNRKFSQNIINYTSTTGRRYTLQKQNSMNRRPSILDKKGRESIKAKYKLLYKNINFILMLISLIMFSLGISVMYTHLLPFAVSQNMSSSVGLLMVSLLAGAGLIGKIALGAIAQSPRVNAIVLYIVAVFLCGMSIHLRSLYIFGKQKFRDTRHQELPSHHALRTNLSNIFIKAGHLCDDRSKVSNARTRKPRMFDTTFSGIYTIYTSVSKTKIYLIFLKEYHHKSGIQTNLISRFHSTFNIFILLSCTM